MGRQYLDETQQPLWKQLPVSVLTRPRKVLLDWLGKQSGTHIHSSSYLAFSPTASTMFDKVLNILLMQK